MFDKIDFPNISIDNRRSCPDRINVNIEERRAATDDSVRLLNEMQQKAEKNFIRSISERINNMFNVEFFVMNGANGHGTLYIQAEVNGDTYQRKVRLIGDNRQYIEAIVNHENYDERLLKFLHLQLVFLVSEILLGQKDYLSMLSDAISKAKKCEDLCFDTLTDKLERGEFDGAKFDKEHFKI